MSKVPDLLDSTAGDLKTLARQYLELTDLKVKDSAKALAAAGVCLGAASLLGALTVAELVFALAIWLVDRQADVAVRTTAVAALLTLVAAALAAFAGWRFTKKVDVDPRVGESRAIDISRREGPTWQTIT